MCAARHPRPPESSLPMRFFTKLLLAVAALGVLAAVFSFYGHGDFVMSMANQVWGCF